MKEVELQVSSADPEHIAISKSTGIQIDWRDGHHSSYTLAYLRDECPCATCTGAHGTPPQRSDYRKQELFPMYKPSLKMNSVEPIGQYAVKLVFDDGHDTGLFTWNYLYELGSDREHKWAFYQQRVREKQAQK